MRLLKRPHGRYMTEEDAEPLLYFQDPPLEKAPKDFDPLAWWKAKEESPESPFVALPIIASLYLSLASTAVGNEGTFSYAVRLLDTLRSTIHPDFACDILFISGNLHPLEHTVNKEVSYKTTAGQATTKVSGPFANASLIPRLSHIPLSHPHTARK